VIAADPPAVIQPAPEAIVVRRSESTQLVASNDQPFVLTKGPQREQAMVRQAIFVTSQITVTRPAAANPATEGLVTESYRWTHQAFLQRQVCFSSISGLFACTEPVIQALPDVERGDAPAPLTEPDTTPLSEAARRRLVDNLKPRAAALFDTDRRRHVDPAFKAAGVVVVRPGTTTSR
jgi:hypothetical protein